MLRLLTTGIVLLLLVSNAHSQQPKGKLDQKWLDRVALLPAEEQVTAVVGKLIELNPLYTGKVDSKKIENNAVVELRFSTAYISNISPVKGLKDLRILGCYGDLATRGKLEDLS